MLAKSKLELRLEAKATLESLRLSARLEAASERALIELAKLEIFQSAQKILFYEALLDELNLNKLKEIYKNKEYLIPQFAHSKAVPSEGFIEICNSVDLVIVPGLAYDRSGYRLGRGGGYYDRLIAALKKNTQKPETFFLGIIVKELLFNKLPHEEHDMPVDFVLSI